MSQEPEGPDPLDRSPLRRSVEQEVADEFDFHLAMRARELAGTGLDSAEARRQAEARFGDLAEAQRLCRELAGHRERRARRIVFFSELAQDFRFALRTLRRRRAFATLAVITTALGIGAATAIYGVVDRVLLRPLPFDEPGRLVAVWASEPERRADPVLSRGWDKVPLGSDEYLALQKATRLRGIALFGTSANMLSNGSTRERVTTLVATSSLLPTLRVHPVLGRGFLPGEDVHDGPKIALLSWETWRSRFAGDSTVIGRSIRLDDYPYTVVGVLPPGLRLDRTATQAAVWVPALQGDYDLPERHNRQYSGVARLAPGATLADAEREASTLIGEATASPAGKSSARVADWQFDQTRDIRGSLLLLLGAVGVLLLIACINVATLMLGETAKREPELAARAALGAGMARLSRQLLTESLVIAGLGALLGCALAWAGTRALIAYAPPQIVRLGGIGLDFRVLAFATGCAVLTGIAFGLVPALTRLKPADYAALRMGTGLSGRRSRGPERLLIAGEVALSLVLLVGCTLLARSLGRLTAVDPGFVPDQMMVVQITSEKAPYDDSTRAARFYASAMEQIAALPGVVTVSASTSAPFTGGSSSSPTRPEGHPADPTVPPVYTQQREPMPGYFATMKIPLLAGRDFTPADRDGAPLVVILSEAAARRDWPTVSAVGHQIFWQGQWRTIVGIVGDIKFARLSREDEPILYAPYAQAPWGDLAIVVRTRGETGALASAIRERLDKLDPAATVLAVIPMVSLVERSYGEERYRTLLVTLFGGMASLLAAVGIFGVISRAQARRTREIGIRLALGSPAFAVIGLMLRETALGIGVGLVVGIPAALLVVRQLGPYLFQITPTDPTSFGLALLVLLGAFLAAALPPAWRANRVDPARVLRSE